MMQVVLFNYDSSKIVQECLLQLKQYAKLEESSAFWFFSEIEGNPKFNFDCEVIEGGIITERKGEYATFLGHFIDHLTKIFGKLELGPEGNFPMQKAETGGKNKYVNR